MSSPPEPDPDDVLLPCPRCGAEDTTLLRRGDAPACVACSTLSDEQVRRARGLAHFDEIESMYQTLVEEVPAPAIKGIVLPEACDKSEASPMAQLPATDCAPSPCAHAETVRDPVPMLDGSVVVRCVACKRPVATTSPARSA